MYRVIKMFTDLQDGNRAYQIGDVYPRQGYTPSTERIDELSSDKNRQGKPLIEKIPKEQVENNAISEVTSPSEEAEPNEELEIKPKRSRKKADISADIEAKDADSE